MTTTELPFFPAPVPAAFGAPPEQVLPMVEPVLDRLAEVIAGSTDLPPQAPTPCTNYDLATLRDHVLGWVQFFAAALTDPQRRAERPDPQAYHAADDPRDLREVVLGCRTDIAAAIRAGVLAGEVAMSQSRMSGPSALAMIVGEYLLHGWDLARATGQPWEPPADACEVCLEFFRGLIVPEYRGGEHGYFGAEVPVPADAPALDRLLGFAGRDPGWQPPR